MAATDRSDASAPAASDVAATIAEAGFVRVLARADGDALAAAGVLGRALSTVGVPFQVGVAPTVAERSRRVSRAAAAAADAVAVSIGRAEDAAATIEVGPTPASVTAWVVADELGAEPDPVLALAGVVAAGRTPGAGESTPILSAAREQGLVRRRPGVAVPTTDLADGLAGSTLVHAPFSGDEAAVARRLADLGVATDDADALEEEDQRLVASLVAVEAVADDASDRAAAAVERALAPYATPDAPFATLAGYADVLDVTAAADPGAALALALGHDACGPALAAWREHARRAHAAVERADRARYDGLVVASLEDAAGVDDAATVAAAARLLRDYRSPEPVVLVVADGVAAAATTRSAADTTAADAIAGRARTAANAVDGAYDGTTMRATIRFDPDGNRAGELVDAFRGAR